ncbi:MAG: ABC transporter permease [Ruminococcaceae bacterium]|nr:ABC transporter permease [Oscillospiraceae bacterium]
MNNLLHLSKRPDLTKTQALLWYMIAIVCAVAVGGLLIFVLGQNPFNYYVAVIQGAFGKYMSFRGFVRELIPLLIASLGVSVAFKMKFWNIGAEGQFIMGAVCACWVGLQFGNVWNHWLLMLVMFLAGVVGGGIFGLIPAFLKCKFGTNETLMTLMLNYIALYLVQWLSDGPWRDPELKGFSNIKQLPVAARVDRIGKIDVSWMLALVLIVAVYVYLRYTKHGYEISVVGDSQNTARYAGINVGSVVMRTMFISAAISGIGGMLKVAGEGTSYTLSTGIANGVGFTAIIVAWLAKLNPIGITVVSILFATLEKGCGVAESKFKLSASVADIVQGLILFVILGFDFFMRYKITFNLPEKKKSSSNNNGGEEQV